MNLTTATAITASLAQGQRVPRNDQERRVLEDMATKTPRQNLAETLQEVADGGLRAMITACVVQAAEGAPGEALAAAQELVRNLGPILGAAAEMLMEDDDGG